MKKYFNKCTTDIILKYTHSTNNNLSEINVTTVMKSVHYLNIYLLVKIVYKSILRCVILHMSMYVNMRVPKIKS